MAMYATPLELASYLKQDVDTSTATLALTIASDLFADKADTRFESNATTYSIAGHGNYRLYLPRTPVIAVSAVRIAGVTLTVGTDYARIGDVLYRRVGFGVPWRFPPDLIEVDYTHGLTAVPDAVKGAVLETAGAISSSPDITVVSEQIDDYSVKTATNAGGFQLSPAAQKLAEWYHGAFVA